VQINTLPAKEPIVSPFGDLIHHMTQAAVAGDGDGVAACFTPDGTYYDVFYGAFNGPREIARLITDFFHRDAENFVWDLFDPVSDGTSGYARYLFSYDSKMEGSKGKRAMYEGVALLKMKDGLFLEYREIANHGTALAMMGFAPERVVKLFSKEATHLAGTPAATGHRVQTLTPKP
jgi:ketosteroid isomerase-like protein